MQVKTVHDGGQVCGDGRHPAGRTQSGNAVVKGVRSQEEAFGDCQASVQKRGLDGNMKAYRDVCGDPRRENCLGAEVGEHGSVGGGGGFSTVCQR